MPANPKYLTPTRRSWTRASKIAAGILGGFAVSVSFHLMLTLFADRANVLITMTFSGFIVWVALMILAFLEKKAWRIWALYLLLTGMFSLVIYLSEFQNPLN